MAQTSTLAFEIGTEEIPAFDLHAATGQLAGIVASELDARRVPHGPIRAYSSPRRLIAIVDDVADETEAVDEEFRGPKAAAAFDAQGNPTKAGAGFARGKGVAVQDLERREVGGTEYVFAHRHLDAQPTLDLIGQALEASIGKISWPKSMRWGARRESFSRPVRWIVALLGSTVVPMGFAGLVAGRTTQGHRVLAPGAHEVASADELLDVVRACAVVPSEAEREERIRQGVAAIERETGLTADLPAKTLLEVVNLSEHPTALAARFDEGFLEVPPEIIVDSMLVNQRYFPLYDAQGSLTNTFILVTNGDVRYQGNIVDGNERVVRARLSDAKFFYEEDLARPLESYVDKLDAVVFQEKLGTVRQKTARIEELAGALADAAGLDEAGRADAVRAAHLAKADLVTSAVIEFTSVQGIMGGYYAQASGETEAVAGAIRDQYRPRYAGDDVPETLVGMVVAAADKLDTICGMFAIGQGPTGSSDPFALRRSAIGILAMMGAGLELSIVDAAGRALDAYEEQGISFDRAEALEAVVGFFVTRTSVMLRDEGIAPDTIDAVLAAGALEPAVIASRARALEAARAEAADTFDNLAVAFARANNLRDAQAGTDADEALMGESEKALLAATDKAEAAVRAHLAANDYAAALEDLAALRAPIDAFFDDVMVMDEDARVRAMRLALLNRFVGVFGNVADFGKMAKSGK